jgi:hypothetical protein
VASPCLFGLLRPTIYLTPVCVGDEKMQHHVLTHELAHLRSGDHIWAWVRCICLCVYWFNPLVWVAASLSRRDCELACDEAVLKQLGETERLAYGKTLLDMVSSVPAPGQLLETATAMHETKKQLKERMKCIVKKQKVFLTAAIILLMVLAVITGCTFSGAFDGPTENTQPTTVPTTTQNDPLKAMTDYELLLQLADKQDCDILTSFKNSQGAAAINRLVNKSPEFKELLTRETALDSIRAHIYSIAKEQKAYSLRQLSRFYDDIQTYMHEVNGIGPASKALEEMTDYELLWEMAVNERIHKMWLSSYRHSDSRVRNLMFFSPEFAELMTRESAADSIKAYATQIDEKLSLNPVVFSGELLSMIDEIEEYEANGSTAVPDVAEIQGLLGYKTARNPYYYALLREFSDPREIELRYFFKDGFGEGDQPTDAEMAVLKEHYSDYMITNGRFFRLPKDRMNEELQRYFGITLADLPDSAFMRVVYLESSDSYGFLDDTTNMRPDDITVVQVEYRSDGTIRVDYTGVVDGKCVVILKADGDHYRILSNEWYVYDDPLMAEIAELFEPIPITDPGRRSYFWATGHTYTNPLELSLYAFYDGGFQGEHEMTEAEREALKQIVLWTDWVDMADFNRLPKDKMDAELQKVFGITLADLPDSAFERLYYLESTDCYYLLQTGMTCTPSGTFTSATANDDGTVTLTYNLPGGSGAITLKPNGDSWLVVSNIQDMLYG